MSTPLSAADVAADSVVPAGRTRTRGRSRFYLGMSIAMLAIVLVGFTPTLYGRAFFNVAQMPGHLYLHGFALTTWYVMLVVQASLVGARRLALHRTLGWATAIFALLIPVAGMGTQLALPGRIRAAGLDIAPFAELIQTIFWLNLTAVLQFTGFVVAAILLRARSEAHKRLLLFASIAMIAPAAARFARWRIFGNTAADLSQPAGTEVLFATGATLLLIAVMVIHDVVSRRRLTRTTAGSVAVLVVMGVAAPLIAGSDWGKSVVWAVS